MVTAGLITRSRDACVVLKCVRNAYPFLLASKQMMWLITIHSCMAVSQTVLNFKRLERKRKETFVFLCTSVFSVLLLMSSVKTSTLISNI